MATITTGVRKFVESCYGLVGASNPRVPLQGSDLSEGLDILNDVLASLSATSLMLTIMQKITIDIAAGTQYVTFGDANTLPVPDFVGGRLVDCQNAWLVFDGVIYPMRTQDRNSFYAQARTVTLQGLPQFLILDDNLDMTQMELYPAADRGYQLIIFGKFQLSEITSNMDMRTLPRYYHRYFRYLCAKEIAYRKGRAKAWTPELDRQLRDLEIDILAITPINLLVENSDDVLLNGADRLQAGV